ncbi:sugar transferase [Chlorobium sp. N1]|uniref:sugar transferase n=1 Tax=Chlorobium sp. N1 TaxID=2491138 RepID=UPI00103ED1D3|nr:sugar transferase [Chlorobium sp. N1]TCD48543.1 NDP-sugar synthase [Chlorobium sp. N1]
MKSLFIVRKSEHAWICRQFSAEHPLLVTLCNKPFIEFLLDFAILAGADAIRIVSDGQTAPIEAYCGNGSRWGIDISYAHMRPEDDRERIMEKNSRFCSEDRVLIIEGVLFIEHDKHADYRSWLSALPEGGIVDIGSGSLSISGEPTKDMAVPFRPLISIPAIECVNDYFSLSAATLGAGTRYILPGYCNEPDCFIGRNVVIQKGAEIRKPVMIGNNVQIMTGAVIGPATIIGSNVIVDRESTVKGSILLDNTFIGEQLEVDRKIGEGNRLTDPASGATLMMEDPHLMSAIHQPADASGLLRQLVHSLAATALVLLLALPWLALRMLPAGRSNRNIIIERYPLLFRVIRGSMRLIGSRGKDRKNSETPDMHIRQAKPSVFGYAEAEQWPETDSDALIVDHYYTRHASPLKDIGLAIKALINPKTF